MQQEKRKDTVRLDKYLAEAGIGSRSEVKDLIRKKMVMVDGAIVTRPEMKIRPFAGLEGNQSIMVKGIEVKYEPVACYMLHKPAGVVTATEDAVEKTVMDLFGAEKQNLIARGYFPVGRLDKDTEGLLLITKDGELAHRLLTPKNHVPKTYFVRADGCITEEVQTLLEGELDIGGGEKSRSAVIAERHVQKRGSRKETDSMTEMRITIYEGKYHQIKRMFAAVGSHVRYLKRLSMGSLILDDALAPGEYRPLTREEQDALYTQCLWEGNSQEEARREETHAE